SAPCARPASHARDRLGPPQPQSLSAHRSTYDSLAGLRRRINLCAIQRKVQDPVVWWCPTRLQRAAEPRRRRPRAEAEAAPAGLLRHPDLLERRPVVGGALQAVEPPSVVELERDVHLEAAVVRGASVAPRGLVAVDAEP